MSTTALITGASRGIGKACALELAQYFDHIIINCKKDADALYDTCEAVQASGTDCIPFIGDVGDYNFVKTMVDSCIERFNTIDCLVNNAGISYVGLLTDMNKDDWDEIISTNLTSVFNCCNLIVPHMVREKSGHIINISSMWGISGASCEVAYSASKGAVNSFTKALAKELAPSNIQVNALACGAIDTNMNSCFSRQELNDFCNGIPVGRLGYSEEIAKMVALLYNSPKYLTGEIIKIDGGYL